MMDVENGKWLSKADRLPNGPCGAGAHLDLSYRESKQGFKTMRWFDMLIGAALQAGQWHCRHGRGTQTAEPKGTRS